MNAIAAPVTPLPMSGAVDVLTIVYLVAITAEAMSGALAAGRRNMDIFGVAVIAFVTALGGGTIRDMVLGRFPVGWTQHPEYIYLVISAGLLTTVIARFMHRLKRAFLFLDAMGLISENAISPIASRNRKARFRRCMKRAITVVSSPAEMTR